MSDIAAILASLLTPDQVAALATAAANQTTATVAAGTLAAPAAPVQGLSDRHVWTRNAAPGDVRQMANLIGVTVNGHGALGAADRDKVADEMVRQGVTVPAGPVQVNPLPAAPAAPVQAAPVQAPPVQAPPAAPTPVWDGTQWTLPAAPVQAPPAAPTPVWDGTQWTLPAAPAAPVQAAPAAPVRQTVPAKWTGSLLNYAVLVPSEAAVIGAWVHVPHRAPTATDDKGAKGYMAPITRVWGDAGDGLALVTTDNKNGQWFNTDGTPSLPRFTRR